MLRFADFAFRRPEVSRRHARLLVSGGRVTLEDLGSRNGTQLGGRRVEGAVTLSSGDKIGVGPCVLVLVSASGQESTRSADGSRPASRDGSGRRSSG